MRRLALLAMFLALPAHADRLFSDMHWIESTPPATGPRPDRYTWEWKAVDSDTPHSYDVDPDPHVRVRGPWGIKVVWRTQGHLFDGTKSEWSEWSEPATWVPDLGCDGNAPFSVADVLCAKALYYKAPLLVFGKSNCDGEWLAGPCP